MTTIEYAKLKIEDAFVRAEKFYNKTFTRPKNIIFKRTGTNAGHCHYGRRELMFQLTLMEQEGESFNSTYYHEVAHYIEKEVYGYQYKDTARGVRRDIHGKNWQYIMKYVMRQDPSRCHNFDVSAVKRKRETYDYVCVNGHNLRISSVIHNRLVSGKRGYRCKCGGCLKLKGNTKEIKIITTETELEKLKKQIAELQRQRNEINCNV